MKQAARILAIVFGLAFVGATLLNADLIGRSRRALASGVLRNESAIAASRYELALIVPDSDDSFFTGLIAGVEDSVPAAEAAVEIFRYSPSTSEDAERYFEIALLSRVDGIIMYAQRNDPTEYRFERAKQANIIFIPVGTDQPSGGLPYFIGSGSILQGFEGGRLICSSLGSAARIGVILAAGGEGDPMNEPLYRGIASAIKAFPGAQVSALIRGEPGLLSGEESTAEMLHSDPAINAIFCTSSSDTIGAAQVIVDQNKVGKILIVGADETPEIVRYIDKGVVSASIVRDSRKIGHEAVQTYVDLKAGRKVPAIIEAGFQIRSAEGLGE
jgi:ribose transport system substrate-binding protein